MFTRLATKQFVQAAKRFSSAAPNAKKYGFQMSAKDIWLGDSGAYPIVAIITAAVTGMVCTSIFFVTRDPDARLTKTQRRAFLRGEHETVGYEDA